jgi:hypothetical protein
MLHDAAEVGINQLGKVERLVETSSGYVFRPHNTVQAENFKIL